MRYDRGLGRGGWETRMPDGGRGWSHGYPEPGQGGGAADRPWVGGYREGYQGGSGGYAMGTSGPLYESYGAQPSRDDHERGYRRPRGQQGHGRRPGTYFVRARAGYGGDFQGAERGDRFAYEDARGGMGFGAGSARPGFGELGRMQGGGGRGRYGADFGGGPRRGGGYARDFGGGTGGGGGYDRGMRGGSGGYDLPFRNEGRPEGYHPRYSPGDTTRWF